MNKIIDSHHQYLKILEFSVQLQIMEHIINSFSVHLVLYL